MVKLLLNKKGFTMVSVAIIVIVTMILISTVAISAVSSLSNAKKINFRADIAYIQDEVDNYYMKSGYTNYPIAGSVTLDLKNVTPKEQYQFVGDVTDFNVPVIMNEIDYNVLGIKQHVYGNNTKEIDKYVLSTKTGKVYYVAGIKAGIDTFYTIVPTLNKEYKRKVVLKSNQLAIDDVLFEFSTLEYTNSPIKVKVKLPNDTQYTDITVTTSDINIIPTVITTVGDYKESDINYTNSVAGNYSINISYKKNTVLKTVQYMVKNYDAVLPTIPSISTISSRNPTDGVVTAFLILSETTDNLSGIKTVKYAEENILLADAKLYFLNNGKTVVDNKIQVKKYPIYTIYVEDNAGNYRVYPVIIEPNILAEIK